MVSRRLEIIGSKPPIEENVVEREEGRIISDASWAVVVLEVSNER